MFCPESRAGLVAYEGRRRKAVSEGRGPIPPAVKTIGPAGTMNGVVFSGFGCCAWTEYLARGDPGDLSLGPQESRLHSGWAGGKLWELVAPGSFFQNLSVVPDGGITSFQIGKGFFPPPPPPRPWRYFSIECW